MRSLWDDRQAAQYVGDLAQCVYASRLLGREETLIPRSGSSTSVKTRERNLFGEEEDVLCITGQDCRLATVEADDFARVCLEHLVRLARLDQLSNARLAHEIRSGSAGASTPPVPLDGLLHAIVPHRFVNHVYPDAVLAIANTPRGLERVREVFGDAIPVIPYARSGFPLAKLCAETFSTSSSRARTDTLGIVLMQHGLVSFGETARACYERTVDLVTRAEQYLRDHTPRSTQVPGVAGPGRPIRHELAALRQSVSATVGFPVIMSTHTDSECLSFARRDDVADISQQGPAVPDHALRTKRVPLLGRDVGAFQVAYQRYVAAHTPAAAHTLTTSDPAPRVILDPEFGMCVLGHTVEEATSVGDIYRHTMEIIRAATALEGYRPLPARDVLQVEGAAREGDVPPIFAGEVALVTGAASGIGKACVESFLARGAAVAGLDINPRITQILSRPSFLGLCCDVTDENGLCQAIETTVRAFGGLDMLVPNAGVFPPGCPIASLQTASWRKVMSVNLDANLVLMREAYPLLKAAPRSGRVVVISSRNVPAPGPGAVAYSASKAALTQLARVAALEWGKDGIRVNILNPHAVFDTGIWTEEVLSTRAAHYGLTVDEYKRNNILRAEVTSRDVGELVAEMCGPLFARSTGAQVPIDGGSNRVI